jgi:hypothetical protein
VIDGRMVAERAEEDAAGPLDEESCVLSGQPVSQFGTIVTTLRRLRAHTLGVRDPKVPMLDVLPAGVRAPRARCAESYRRVAERALVAEVVRGCNGRVDDMGGRRGPTVV